MLNVKSLTELVALIQRPHKREEIKQHLRAIDRAQPIYGARDGFSPYMSVHSDGKRVNKRWLPGMSVGRKVTHYDSMPYGMRIRMYSPLPEKPFRWANLARTRTRGGDPLRNVDTHTRRVRPLVVKAGQTLAQVLFGV